MACKIPSCLSSEHNKTRHDIACRVCGHMIHHKAIPETWTEAYRELVDGANCHNKERHAVIRNSFTLGADGASRELGYKIATRKTTPPKREPKSWRLFG